MESIDAAPANPTLEAAVAAGTPTVRIEPGRGREWATHVSIAEWEGPLKVNLYGVMNCCKAVIDGMCDREWGRIVTISSGAGTGGVAIGVSPYSAGKGGGIAFTRTLALEVARSGVTANTIALGLMTNPDQAVTEHLARAIPVGRTGRPDDN